MIASNRSEQPARNHRRIVQQLDPDVVVNVGPNIIGANALPGMQLQSIGADGLRELVWNEFQRIYPNSVIVLKAETWQSVWGGQGCLTSLPYGEHRRSPLRSRQRNPMEV